MHSTRLMTMQPTRWRCAKRGILQVLRLKESDYKQYCSATALYSIANFGPSSRSRSYTKVTTIPITTRPTANGFGNRNRQLQLFSALHKSSSSSSCHHDQLRGTIRNFSTHPLFPSKRPEQGYAPVYITVIVVLGAVVYYYLTSNKDIETPLIVEHGIAILKRTNLIKELVPGCDMKYISIEYDPNMVTHLLTNNDGADLQLPLNIYYRPNPNSFIGKNPILRLELHIQARAVPSAVRASLLKDLKWRNLKISGDPVRGRLAERLEDYKPSELVAILLPAIADATDLASPWELTSLNRGGELSGWEPVHLSISTIPRNAAYNYNFSTLQFDKYPDPSIFDGNSTIQPSRIPNRELLASPVLPKYDTKEELHTKYRTVLFGTLSLLIAGATLAGIRNWMNKTRVTKQLQSLLIQTDVVRNIFGDSPKGVTQKIVNQTRKVVNMEVVFNNLSKPPTEQPDNGVAHIQAYSLSIGGKRIWRTTYAALETKGRVYNIHLPDFE